MLRALSGSAALDTATTSDTGGAGGEDVMDIDIMSLEYEREAGYSSFEGTELEDDGDEAAGELLCTDV